MSAAEGTENHHLHVRPRQWQDGDDKGCSQCILHLSSTKIQSSPGDEESIRHMTEAGFTRLPEGWKDNLDAPLTADELRAAISIGDAK
jgi:hypothetical protein